MEAGSPELLALVGELAVPDRREAAAALLADRLGGERLLLFSPDPELDVLLPAPGFPQVLRGSGQWREFLERCVGEGACAGTVPDDDGRPTAARGVALADGTAAVLLGVSDDGVEPESLRPILPLLRELFRMERQRSAEAVRSRAAADAVERANLLTRALQQMRERLQEALIHAEEARAESRDRAEQAEALAEELQAQALQLQDQAMELETLNDELGSRTAEAERASAEADAANRAKSDFLASMSHELRTPINAVIGYADLLHMGVTGPVTEEQKNQLERIQASSAHLLTLVNDILDLSKVEAGHMTVHHEREPVAKVVVEAVGLMELQAKARQISLESECPDSRAVYVGDRDRVRQILVNLISNAVKFTDPGGAVTVECHGSEIPDEAAQLPGEGPWTCFVVRDTGIGMDEDDLPEVFQPFVQVESGHTRSRGGTGLGLTISRQLARLMGGDLTVRSRKGEGSTFTLWLPAESPESGVIDPTIRVGRR